MDLKFDQAEMSKEEIFFYNFLRKNFHKIWKNKFLVTGNIYSIYIVYIVDDEPVALAMNIALEWGEKSFIELIGINKQYIIFNIYHSLTL